MNEVLNNGIIQINQLINKSQYREAYMACGKLLLNFPENGKLHSLKKKIEKLVFKQNVISVKKDLKAIKPLWDEKKYGELVEKLTKLQSYVPGYGPVEKQLEKSKILFQKYTIQHQKDSIKDYIKNIGEQIRKKDFEKAITMAKQLLVKIPDHEQAAFLLDKSRKLFIDEKINKNKHLLSGNNFEDIEKFLKELLKIKPDSDKVKLLLKKASQREKITIDIEKQDFAYKSYEHIQTLYKKKKYGKTIDALNELLTIEPDNLKYLELLDKAKKKFDKTLNKEVIKKIITLQKKLKAEYRKSHKKFIRI